MSLPTDLFAVVNPATPLAERLRPKTIDEVIGQRHLLDPGKPLAVAFASKKPHSMILWGPPGVGKTTLARLMADAFGLDFIAISAVLGGVKDIRDAVERAQATLARSGRPTVVFVDEVHRFNKAQQDAFLPHVESGLFVFVGATTENPSFEVNAALLSRCAVYTLRALSDGDLVAILKRARASPQGLSSRRVEASDEDLLYLASLCGGDARRALNILELLATTTPAAPDGARRIDRTLIARAAQRAPLLYDKSGEEHFNLISALHKSLRNSDADAAIYWLVRMLESGEDPLYVARRMVRFASEDVGNADPQALAVALRARDAYDFLGMPEGALALAQAAAYLALAPKSNALYIAVGRVEEDLRSGLTGPVPLAIRNAPTSLMKDLGYGRDYQYAHDLEEGTADMECLPERLRGRRYYEPKPAGFEKTLQERMKEIESLKARRRERRGVKPSP